MAAVSICACATAKAADIDVVASQTALNSVYALSTLDGDRTWTKDNIYILTDRVYVPAGVTLTIEPGTKIYSTFKDVGADSDPTNDTVGALIVCRGGMIDADGTAAEPIVFDAIQTLEAERGTDLPYDDDLLIGPKPTASTTGLWGGIVVLGNAYIAVTDSNGDNIGNKIIEGFVPTGFADGDGDSRPDVLEYGFDLTTNTRPGGTTFLQDDADNSGTIRYVSIRHGGYEFGNDNEINGLTLAGVGSGTTIEFVEVVANADDGVEWFGGTVNTRNLVVAYCADDSFDIDEGHQGTHQFLFTIQNPNFGDNLGEWDGVGGASKASTKAGVIRSNPKIFNATMIGAGATSFENVDVKKDNGIFMDDYFNGQLLNSVVLDSVNFLTSFDSDGNGGAINFEANTVGTFGKLSGTSPASVLNAAPTDYYISGFGVVNKNNSAPGTNPLFTAYSRTAEGFVQQIDPRPASGSPLLSATLAATAAPTVVSYRGAFDGTTNWAAGWTFLDANGFFSPPATPTLVDVVATQTALNTVYALDTLNGNQTWTKDKTYILTDRVYVPEGVTLTIQPGTKIYSTFEDVGADSDPTNDTVGALIVCRGGMINASGTAAEPIVFSALQALEAELGVDLPFDTDGLIGPAPTASTTGLWGGIVVLGNAYIAVTDSNGDNIGNKIIEGFVPTGFADGDGDSRPDVLEYGFDLTTNTRPGGTTFLQDDADNSGTIRYVSIRHGGYEFGNDNEINGLTLAGVGSGTTIEFVEVVANADDGVEWFGGTVNTRNLVVAYCADDSFDIDEGHQGTHQFLFTIQNPNFGDNLGEWDGVGGASKASTKAGVIRSNPKIFNATMIGAGATSFENVDVKKDNGIFMDDYFNGQLLNSVVLDSVNFLTSFDSDGNGGAINFEANTVGIFGKLSGTSPASVLNAAPTDYYISGFGAVNKNNSAPGTNPMFTGYARNTAGFIEEIDPRPAAGSTLLNATLAATAAPTVVSYRGAFDGTTNWAAGWTYLDEIGLFSVSPDSDGDGLTDEQEGILGTNPNLADTDGDGINDFVEASNLSLGLNPIVADANGVLSSLFTTSAFNQNFTDGQSSVVNNPNVFSLFTTSDIQELSADDIVVQKSGSTVTLTIPVERSGDLETFEPELNATLTIDPVPDDKEFYRFRIGPPNPPTP